MKSNFYSFSPTPSPVSHEGINYGFHKGNTDRNYATRTIFLNEGKKKIATSLLFSQPIPYRSLWGFFFLTQYFFQTTPITFLFPSPSPPRTHIPQALMKLHVNH